MSRSYKKNAIIKDNGQSHKYMKKKAHHTTRAKVRQVLTSGKEYDELLFPTTKSKELVNQYDICDWKWRLDEHTIRDSGYSYGNGMWFEYSPRYIKKFIGK